MSLKTHSLVTLHNHEGPGLRLVVFLQGCNFKCLNCPNPDIQSSSRSSILYSCEEILNKIAKLKKDEEIGLTVSGGEPTLQMDEVLNLFKKAKVLNIHTALDTNAYISNEKVHNLYTYTDLLIVDLKHINSDKHKAITSKTNTTILENLKYRKSQGKPIWLRYSLIPNYSDQEIYLHQFGRHFENYQNIQKVEIMPYHSQGVYKYAKLGLKYKLENTRKPSQESIDKAKSIFEKYFNNVYIR